MKKLGLLLTVCSLATGLCLSPVMAQDFDSKPPMPAGKHKMQPDKKGERPDLTKALNLTPEQVEKSKQIREEGRKKMEPIVNNIKAEKKKLMELKQSGASEAEIAAQREKIKGLFEQAKVVHKENFEKFQQILTAEQKAKLKKMEEKRHAEMKKRFEKAKKEGKLPPSPVEKTK